MGKSLTNKQKKQIKKNLKIKKVKHYVIIRDSVFENPFVSCINKLKNDVKVGDNVTIIPNSSHKFSNIFKEAVLRSMQVPIENLDFFDKRIREFPNKFSKVKNQDGKIGYIPYRDLYEISSKDFDKTTQNKIIDDNQYLVKSGILDWFKENTFNPFTKDDNGLIRGSEKLKERRKLYHCTSAQEAIMKSGEWRMSHFKFEDDDMEFEYTFNLMRKCAVEIGDVENKIELLISSARKIISQSYLLSLASKLTKEMWDHYGANNGVAIEFDENILNSHLNAHLHTNIYNEPANLFDKPEVNKFRIVTLDHVIYDKEEQYKKIKLLTKDYLRDAYSNKNDDFITMADTAGIFAMFFKDPKWSNQEEVRFVAIQNSLKLVPDGFQTTSNYDKVPYVKFPLFNPDKLSPISMIYTRNESDARKIFNYFKENQVSSPILNYSFYESLN
ncbi:DUF2971 domain-containing protein [Pediococcus pentosaceus]|uniref:DUF2971 domain-containing protein n=1 Tax=Pediococcus pentosaceus TaxID=1255 RepID=UPI002F26D498